MNFHKRPQIFQNGRMSPPFCAILSFCLMSHLQGYPPNLPVPVDDGACDHLVGSEFPADVLLQATTPASDADGPADLLPATRTRISVAQLSYQGLVIVFFYPRTAPPEEDVPPEWNAIPGARGCTPQNCQSLCHSPVQSESLSSVIP